MPWIDFAGPSRSGAQTLARFLPCKTPSRPPRVCSSRRHVQGSSSICAAAGQFHSPSCPETNGASASDVGGRDFLDMAGKFRRRALLWWPEGVPSSVMIVKKRNNSEASMMLKRIADWLRSNNLRVLVEEEVHAQEFPEFDPWTIDQDIPDFCVTLGGDGTVLHTASLFRQEAALPPVIAFAMGTLGFLTPFVAANFEPLLSRVIRANEQAVFCTLRTQLLGEVFSGSTRTCVAAHHAFNELVIDRGPSVNFLQMDAYIDGSYITTIQGDGLIVATPSGSTAYSLSAGGPMVAPSVPCMLLTPIAPHSLSFRPVVVAETSDIVIHVPATLQDEEPARVAFDGKHMTALKPADSVRVSIARWPLPMITAETMDLDWFVSITEKLMWNAVIKRDRRKPLPEQLPTATALDALNMSLDECTLDVAGCVLIPPASPTAPEPVVRPASSHHTGQSLQDIDERMPIYCPNTVNPADCRANMRASRDSFSSGDCSGDASDSAPAHCGTDPAGLAVPPSQAAEGTSGTSGRSQGNTGGQAGQRGGTGSTGAQFLRDTSTDGSRSDAPDS